MIEPGTLSTQLARLRDHIDPHLTSGDVERLVVGAARLHRRRRWRRWVLATSALTASLLVILHVATRPPMSAPLRADVVPARIETRAQGPVIRLQDGSFAASPEGPAVISLEEDTPRRATLVLREGKMRFHVIPTRERTFTVKAGAVKVTVLGMAFTMERIADRVSVSADGSPLLVEWGSEHRLLEVGESGWFPPAETEVSWTPAGQLATAAQLATGAARARSVHATAASPRSGAVPTGVPPTLTTPTVTARLEAADAARQSGRPREGADLLQRIVDEHPEDPRAPLAAFTLGRVLLRELGRPREAAAAFAQARVLAPRGPFAEDALAREVEAWASTEEIATRRARAATYLRLYPAGRRAAAMAAWAAP